MTMRDLVRWAAFERLYGPLLVQERVDVGFAQLSYYLVSLLGQSKRGRRWKIQDFLPPWIANQSKRQPQSPEQLRAFMEGLVNRAND
jgi:hypothetical protein